MYVMPQGNTVLNARAMAGSRGRYQPSFTPLVRKSTVISAVESILFFRENNNPSALHWSLVLFVLILVAFSRLDSTDNVVRTYHTSTDARVGRASWGGCGDFCGTMEADV
jgi:hypothetical protein